MIIDETAFYGETEVGQINDVDIINDLKQSIATYEPEYLKAILGYQTWKEFMDALVSGTPEQKWLDLLNGVDYYDKYGQLQRFTGLASLSLEAELVTGKTIPDDIIITVNGSGPYDPVEGTRAYTNPGLLEIPSSWRLFREGLGPMTRYTPRADGFDLPIEDIFSSNDVFVIQFRDPVFTIVEGLVPQTRMSPIAYYVYYWHERTRSSATTGGGEAIQNKHNSRSTTNRRKQSNAWNKMVELNEHLVCMMRGRQSDYPYFYAMSNPYNRSWYYRNKNRDFWNLLSKINFQNI